MDAEADLFRHHDHDRRPHRLLLVKHLRPGRAPRRRAEILIMNQAELLSNEELRRHEFPVVASKIFLAHAGVCPLRSEEHTSELQSRFGIPYPVFCLKKKKTHSEYVLFLPRVRPPLAPTAHPPT